MTKRKARGVEDQCLCFLTPPLAASRQTDTTENHGIQYRQSWNGSGLTSSGSHAQSQNSVQLFHYHESCFITKQVVLSSLSLSMPVHKMGSNYSPSHTLRNKHINKNKGPDTSRKLLLKDESLIRATLT